MAIAEGVANLAISIFLVRKIGLIGVAWGTVIPHLISTGVIIPMYVLRTLKLSPLEYFRRGYVRPLICAIPTAVLCYALSVTVDKPTWPLFGMEVLAVATLFGGLAYFICIDRSQRRMVHLKLSAILQRKTVAEPV